MTSTSSTTSTAGHAAQSNYYRPGRVMRALRFALTTSQRLWPALGVRAAYRLFGTPLPPKWLYRAQGPGAEWRREGWAFEDAGVGIYHLAAQDSGAESAPVVLLVHGWGGHAGQMLPLAQAVADAGLRPVLLELPAHGRSAGTMSNSPQFARAIAYVAARLAADGHALRAAVAHSLGANGLALAAARGLPAQRLVLLAPPASPREYTRYFAHTFGLSETTRLAMQRLFESREGVLMPQLEPAAVGPRIGQRTLIVHDRDDRVNRFADAEAYRDAIRGAQLMETQGWGHRRILKETEVLARVVRFVTAPD
ncbi:MULTISPECIES: alpha/beta fold hydrolase [Variovorax]|jgi:pimeloyl-ACP methyl ester carboxylesterase|uniref:alpha/beta fold hydrolase n=1 Tax=Variovorax TaxID=34072 RepID=UPI00086DAC35|nr:MULTISPECIES: alpha/beta hydrolase [Variovorax]MBN8755317.1 alpha/beta fold hydrolase [Variovorax sp.]ODU15935.1 MAG: lysophospholipase [Variovorax sp. SCN 67-85]ODV21306.1 MAG: lysophospholipase [Variovorax sp. SCN 67-20]OJZ14132.1 MAG: lysophospholipase [Variovorax sp. 67-131]UKI08471.1 alpha/beta hydrolase [Variovorax paradoxus]